MFDDWLPFVIYGFFALAIPSTMIVASFVFATRPKHGACAPGRFRSNPASRRGPPAKQRFTVSFYLTAMLFILFDIEIVFLYPLAVILHELAWFGFVEFLVFLGHPAARLRLHLAEGSARVAVEKPLRDLGLHSERLLWPDEGAGQVRDGGAATSSARSGCRRSRRRSRGRRRSRCGPTRSGSPAARSR